MAEHGAEGFWTQVGLAAGAVGAGVIAVARAMMLRERKAGHAEGSVERRETDQTLGVKLAAFELRLAAMEKNITSLFERFEELLERVAFGEGVRSAHEERPHRQDAHRADPPWQPRKRGGGDEERF
ncbi:MAG: hypothetical protein HYV27_15360 [Candidatus Hydrogenedentes bacterium]|nr:hypothetical protein [Candidatus Hydrogenedentota bacterium]